MACSEQLCAPPVRPRGFSAVKARASAVGRAAANASAVRCAAMLLDTLVRVMDGAPRADPPRMPLALARSARLNRSGGGG